MPVATPPVKPTKSSSDPVPHEPPAEKFWEKYSPHHEFPISTFATGAIHVLVVALIIYITTRLMKADETTPVPVRGMIVLQSSAGSLSGAQGSGGGEEHKEATDERPQDPQRQIPEAELKKEVVSVSAWLDIKDADAAKTIAASPNYEKLRDINDDIKKRLRDGFGGTKGTGKGPGEGNTEPGPGGGNGGAGDATSSGNRSMRWTIIFKTNSGADYLKQLNAFKAKIVVPEPPTWKKNRLFEDITVPSPGKPLGDEELPKMYFSDTDKISASKVARALGLNFDPPLFIAFFPKDVEDELAKKESAYRNRKEEDIYSTTFRVLERNGQYEIKVTDQIPVRK